MMRMMVMIKMMVMMMMGMGMIMMTGMGMIMLFRQLKSLCCTLGCTAVVQAICHKTIEPIAREARFARVGNTLRLARGDQTQEKNGRLGFFTLSLLVEIFDISPNWPCIEILNFST